jgi:hypothetical protein
MRGNKIVVVSTFRTKIQKRATSIGELAQIVCAITFDCSESRFAAEMKVFKTPKNRKNKLPTQLFVRLDDAVLRIRLGALTWCVPFARVQPFEFGDDGRVVIINVVVDEPFEHFVDKTRCYHVAWK